MWGNVFDKAFFNVPLLQIHKGERELIASRERIQNQAIESKEYKKKGGKKVDVCITIRGKDNFEILTGESKKKIGDQSNTVKNDLLKLQVMN